MKPPELAGLLGVKLRDLTSLETKDAHALSDLPADPMWTDIAAEVDKHIGELMAIREELRRKLARDDKRRMARRMRISSR